MVKVKFSGPALNHELSEGFSEISRDLGIVIGEGGLEVVLESSDTGLSVMKDGNKATIRFSKRVEFYRALGLLLEHRQDENVSISETNRCQMLGTMVDNSRNAVMNIPSIKRLLRYMALMGHNTLMLYTEDTYEIEGYPYFGYMRGRFTAEELQVCDNYAHKLGIELVPCIQTLAHLNAALRWKPFSEVHDCNDILLAGEEKTYQLIDAMLSTMAKNLRSRNINIGMDEAEMLGFGKYLQINGFKNRSEIMLNHLKRVVELCNKYGYKPMMWSDMFFKLADSGTYYEGKGIPKEVIDKVPEGVTLVYWDYYSIQSEKVSKMLDKHLQFNNPCAFAGGAWRWRGYAPMNGFSLFNSRVILEQCKLKGIHNIFVTAWGDDGAECSMFAVLPALQLFAEYGYEQNMENDHLSRRLQACTGLSLEGYLLLDSPNNLPGNEQPGRWGANPSRYMLYQDILTGLFDRHVVEGSFAEYFAQQGKALKDAADRNPLWKDLFLSLAHLCDILEIKCDMGVRLKKAYDSNDRNAMEGIADQIPDLQDRLDIFYEDIRNQWLKENKPFGFDVISMRLGALKTRIGEAKRRIGEYLSGKAEKLDELEQDRLYYDGRTEPGQSLNMEICRWSEIVTANVV